MDFHLPNLSDVDLLGGGDARRCSELLIAVRLGLFVAIGAADQLGPGARLGHRFIAVVLYACIHVAGQRTAFPVISCSCTFGGLGSTRHASVLINCVMRGGGLGRVRGQGSVALIANRAGSSSL